MAGFNQIKDNSPKFVSYEGGEVYEKSVVDEWVNFLFSSFMEDRFYESRNTQLERFLHLTNTMASQYGYSFVAKAAIFVRNELGMRSVSQFVAAWLNDKSFENKRAFYKTFMHRPDDVAEIFAALDVFGQKRSHALIRGSADYLSSLNDYSIGKYKLNSRTYNMYDLINLTHANSNAINSYKRDILNTPDTWETAISTASKEDRSQEWMRLVEERKLGYMALIRNLNNILAVPEVDNSWIEYYLIPQIENEYAIKKSLVFPYRIYTAYKNLNIRNFLVITALEKAFRIAVSNMPELSGHTGILLDVSGSMEDHISAMSQITLKQIGACFAVAIFIANSNVEMVKFGTHARSVKLAKADNVFHMIDAFCKNDGCGYSTYIEPAFSLLNRNSFTDFDRIFIISDMQIMDKSGYYSNSAVNNYRKYFKNTPAYSFDLGNYHTQILSTYDNIYYFTALSEQVFKFIEILESHDSLVDYINSFNYC